MCEKVAIFVANFKYYVMEPIKRRGSKIEINRDDLAVELKMYRCKQGLTQRQLADEWGVSRWSIIRTEAAQEVSIGLTILIYARLTECLRKQAEGEL